MDLRRLGGSGVSVSAIGLGGYELGPEPEESADVARAVTAITQSRDAGVNWLDTSENYLQTRNESLIGEAVTSVGRDFLIATKVAPGASATGGGSGFRRDQVHAACRGSLARLQRDVIDIYFLHWPDDSDVPLEETWGAMGELVDQGLVRAIGMSNYALDDIERCHAQRPVDAIQTGLNLLDFLDDRPLIAACAELGIAVTIYEPLASGILTGRALDQIRAQWAGTPWENSGFYRRLLLPGKGEQSAAVAQGLQPIAEGLGATVAQVAISWVLHQRGVSAAITGNRDGRHMRENVGACGLALAPVLDEIEQLIRLGPGFG